MYTVSSVIAYLEECAPLSLAAEWDNVGLLVGDSARSVQRIMTCLSVTPITVKEAVEAKVDLVVTHHPFPFNPLKRITSASVEGKMLLDLTGAGIAVYSAHTAFDSAIEGINQQLAKGLGLSNIAPLIAPENGTTEPTTASVAGTGRVGSLQPALSLGDVAGSAAQFLKLPGMQIVGDAAAPISKVAIACGSAGELLSAAKEQGCDLFITGETRFHTCLEAEGRGIALLLLGHYASERFGMERLAEALAVQFPDAEIWPSRQESDPIRWINARLLATSTVRHA